MTLAWLLPASWSATYAVISTVAIVRSMKAGTAAPPATAGDTRPIRRVCILRPCAGSEPCLDRTLGSTPILDTRFEWSIRLTVATPDDPALPRARAATALLAARGVEAETAVVPTSGPNFKTGQLAGAVGRFASQADAIVVVDSDVDLEGVDLTKLLAPLEIRSVAAAYFPPVERGPLRTLGDRASQAVLGGSWHAFCILGALDPHGLVGKTFAVRTDALAQVGGFDALVRHLGEDMELARRLHRAGWDTLMVPEPVVSLASGRSVSRTITRYARWLMVIRAQRPGLLVSYPLLLAAAPVLMAWSIALALTGFASAGALIALVTLAARLAVGWAAARASGRRTSLGWLAGDAVLADVVLWIALLRALGPARVRWRDRTLRLGKGGLLEPVSSTEARASACA